MDIEKLNLQSPDLVNENLEKLAELFPHCITEGAEGKTIDFDLLKQELNHEVVEGNKERYRLEWPGKREAIVTANRPTTQTLRPVREDSVDYDKTENLYIEGDNLEVLKLLRESYLGKIKMIYIDPPYNTGNDFIYKDNFSKDAEKELIDSGQKNEDNQRLFKNLKTAGRYHSDWLSMMYPRLKLARNLLADDGMIFISIDDNEVHNMKKICDDIFGELNFRNTITLKRGAKSVQAQFETWDKLGQNFEYILFYTKKSDYRFPKQSKLLDKPKDGSWNNHWRGTDRPSMRYELFGIKPEKGQWRWGEDRSRIAINNYQKLQNDLSDLGDTVSQKNIDNYYKEFNGHLDLLRLSQNGKPEHYIPPTNFTLLNSSWMDILVGSSSEISQLFEEKVFDTPKLTKAISRMIDFLPKNALILDFFSGSASTAQAVFQKNAESDMNHKFILVQLHVKTDEESEACKAGYKSICEIGKERIRRAAKKIKKETNADIDYGFRVYRLDSSNMEDVYHNPKKYDQSNLDRFADNVKLDRSPDDLLAQVMLDWGLPLSLKIEQATICGKNVFKVAENSLFACFDAGIDEDFTKAIAKEAPLRFVFKDSCFKSDTAKINVQQLLKQLSPTTEMKVI